MSVSRPKGYAARRIAEIQDGLAVLSQPNQHPTPYPTGPRIPERLVYVDKETWDQTKFEEFVRTEKIRRLWITKLSTYAGDASLGIRTRLANILTRYGIETDEQLYQTDPEARKKWEGVGVTIRATIDKYLHAKGYVLWVPEPPEVEGVVLWMHPTDLWTNKDYYAVRSACEPEGPYPIPLVQVDLPRESHNILPSKHLGVKDQ